jgi:leucyl aminopeptidase
MHPAFVTGGDAAATPIWFVTAATWGDVRAHLDARACAFATAAGFEPLPGRHALLPGADGALAGVLFGIEDEAKPFNPFLPGTLAGVLPRGTYRFANAARDPRLAALAIALGAYRFVRYGKAANEVRLELPDDVDGADLSRIAEGVRRRARSPDVTTPPSA